MLMRKSFWWLPLASVFLLVTGCRAPLAVNRALVPRHASLQDKKLFGVWELRQRPRGAATSVVCVYPLGKRRYVITCSIYKPGVVAGKPDLKGGAAFIGSLSAVRGRLWLSCRSMDPRLINSKYMQSWWTGRLPAGQPKPYGSVLKKLELKTARATGMARIFYLVELGAVSPDRLDAYPLLVPNSKGGRSTFKVPVTILLSRKNLSDFLNAHTLAHLLPKQPWILDRMTGQQADVYMPAQ
jgi:hypothetical protein